MTHAETFDWSTSAKQYEQLYRWAVEQRTGVKYLPVTAEVTEVTVDEAVVEAAPKAKARTSRSRTTTRKRVSLPTPVDMPGLVAAVVPAV